jgi:hypothetical protein
VLITRDVMDNPDYEKLKETGWRRPLNDAEEQLLREMTAAQPGLQAKWDEEAALNRLLGRIPSAHVSSNFTARVLQAARHSPSRSVWTQRLAPFQWLSSNWMPRVALVVAMLVCGCLSFRGYQAIHGARRAREIAELPPLPPEWMKDFDTINRLNKVSVADDELLALLQ